MLEGDWESFAPAQRQRLHRFSVSRSVDVHCHCLPGLDDGPSTLEQAIELCGALVADGITHVIATPHQLGAYEGENDAAAIRAAVARLSAELSARSIPLQVSAGADVRVDDRLLELLGADQVLTLGDGGIYLLLELPHNTLVDLRPLIRALVDRGIVPILSHPERQTNICRNPNLLLPWIELGALLQVTAASLGGAFGPGAEQVSWRLIRGGLVSLVASDAHDARQRSPSMTLAIDAISDAMGHAVARKLCVENPRLVLEGEPISRFARMPVQAGGVR